MRAGLEAVEDAGEEEGHKVLIGDVGDAGFWEGVRKEVSFVTSLFLGSHFRCSNAQSFTTKKGSLKRH